MKTMENSSLSSVIMSHFSTVPSPAVILINVPLLINVTKVDTGLDEACVHLLEFCFVTSALLQQPHLSLEFSFKVFTLFLKLRVNAFFHLIYSLY